MTDPEFADATYIEPITPEIVEKIIIREKPDALLPTAGRPDGAQHRRCPFIISGVLAKHGVLMIGANADAIRKGEDRQLFKDAMEKIGLDMPISGVAHTLAEASDIASRIGDVSAHHPARVHHGRDRRRHRLQPRGIRGDREARARSFAGERGADRGIAAGLEGI